MTGPKTNEREGTRAQLRYAHVSPYKVRVVLDLIRGHDVDRARDILRFCERDAATLVGKLLDSAIANAEHNDDQVPDELFVSACYADEGPTLRRFRPRARGRASRIRKRTCHVTVIVSRLPSERLARKASLARAEEATRRARRVAGGRRGAAAGSTSATTPPSAEARRRFGLRRRGAEGAVAGEGAEVEGADHLESVDGGDLVDGGEEDGFEGTLDDIAPDEVTEMDDGEVIGGDAPVADVHEHEDDPTAGGTARNREEGQ